VLAEFPSCSKALLGRLQISAFYPKMIKGLNREVAAMMAVDYAPRSFIAKHKGIALLMALALQGIEQNI
jgi:hypothetical protein